MTAAHALLTAPLMTMTAPKLPESEAPKGIVLAAMRDPTKLISHVREGKILALSYADYGTIECVRGLSYAQDEESADSNRLFVSAVAYGHYVSKQGDVLYHPSGNGYFVADPRSSEPFEQARSIKGERLIHVVLAEVAVERTTDLPLRPLHSPDTEVVQVGDSLFYRCAAAYATFSPDREAAHELLAHPKARIVQSALTSLASPRLARFLAQHGLLPQTETAMVTMRGYDGRRQII